MGHSRTYSKREISKVLTKASEIQADNDIFDNQEGLTEEELIHVAEEVGISRKALIEALHFIDQPELDAQSYSLIKGTSRIQNVSTVKAEISDEQWGDLVLEIRKVTGGIGKIRQTGKTYEWEQRKSEFGFKHFTFTPKDGQTRIQMVSSWGPFKMLAGFLSFFFAFVVTLVFVTEISSKQLSLIIALLVGLGGFAMSRFFLKSYFKKQKSQLEKLTHTLSQKIKTFENFSNTIKIEDEDLYQSQESMNSRRTKESDA